MDNKKSKILTIIAALIGVVGLILFIRVILAGDDSEAVDGAVGGYVFFAKYLFIIAAVIAVGLSIGNLVKHPQALKKTLMALVVLAVLLAIAYFMASGDAVTNIKGDVIKDGEAGATSKWVSALINFTGILGVLGLVAIGQGFVKSLVK